VVDGLNQLLGFGLIERLVRDLDTLRRAIQREIPGASEAGLELASDEVERLDNDAKAMHRDLWTANKELEAVEERLGEINDELNVVFQGNPISARSEALDALTARERDLAVLLGEVQTFVAEVLAVGLPARLLAGASAAAAREASARRDEQARQRLRFLGERLRAALLEGSPRLEEDLRTDLERRFVNAWASVVDGPEEQRNDLFAFFSTDDLERLPMTAEQVADTARRELAARLARRDHLQREIARLRKVQDLFDTNSRVNELLARKADLITRRAELGVWRSDASPSGGRSRAGASCEGGRCRSSAEAARVIP